MARKEYRKPWSLPLRLHFRGTRMQASAKILSRRLAVIEMAFAAVYSVVHAARRRQKGFNLAANFLGENGSGSAVAMMIAQNRLPSISVSIFSGVCDGHARHSGNSHDFLVALTRIDPNQPPTVCLHITTACPLPIVIYGLRGRPACSPNPSLRCTTVDKTIPIERGCRHPPSTYIAHSIPAILPPAMNASYFVPAIETTRTLFGVGEDTRRKKEEKEQKETKDHRDRTGINDLPKLWQRPPKRRQNVLCFYHSSPNPFLR
ncbi:hypothetical protein ALC60_07936 [Trachymyrmex zeteki]|uniref:Uncharacterized protein n=1 Tax=Mycetomoellerius zeteki TaxID=64791 RepID=A0A151WZV1_9HYME|nr:hypothetical protein ALC60_07936 [Trachymyrmex zeteki]